MVNFEFFKLSELAEVIVSGVDKKSKPGQKEVRLCNFTDVYYNWAITSSLFDSFMVATAKDNEIETLSIKKGYVALTKDSETRYDIGISTYIADEFDDVVLGYHCALIKPNEKVLCGKYLNCLLQTQYARTYFANNAKGSGQRYSLTQDCLNDMKIPLPMKNGRVDMDYQEKVGNLFSSIDRKIEINQQINRNLEELARLIYDYWFVQFDFPDKNGKPYKSSGGKMVWNETLKREIPNGWKNGVLIDIANITMGQSPAGSSYNEDGNGTIFYQGSTDFGIRFPSVRQYTTEPTRFAKKGDILMSVRAPVGATNIAAIDCCIGRGLCAMNSRQNSTSLLYFMIEIFKDRFANKNAAGTTFGAITKDELFSLPVVIAPQEIVDGFERQAKPVFEKQMKIGEEINELTNLRNFLLPLLMNGQASLRG